MSFTYSSLFKRLSSSENDAKNFIPEGELNFKNKKMLGEGAYGSVYLILHNGKKVALKENFNCENNPEEYKKLLKTQGARQEIPQNLVGTSLAKLITLGWSQEKKERPTIKEMINALDTAAEEWCALKQ